MTESEQLELFKNMFNNEVRNILKKILLNNRFYKIELIVQSEPGDTCKIINTNLEEIQTYRF